MPVFGPRYEFAIQPPPLPSTVTQANTLTQRPSRQSPGGFPILNPGANQYGVFPYGSPVDIVNQPLPQLPLPGQEQFPGFDPDLARRIEATLNPAVNPLFQRQIDVLTGIGQEASAAGQARAKSGALRSGRSGSSLEEQAVGEAIRAGTAATQASVLPVLQEEARQANENRQQLASFLTNLGTLDAANKRDAILRYTDRQVAAGQFDINNLMKLRETMASLVQREIEDLRTRGFDEKRLAQEKEIRLKELDQRLEEIRLNAENARKDAQFKLAQPGLVPGYQVSPQLGVVRPVQQPGASYQLPVFTGRF